MLPWQADLQAELEARQAAGTLRRLRERQGPQSKNLWLDGKPLLSFISNDYLGLANHPAVKNAFATEAARTAGSGAAHLLSGHSRLHQQCQERLADFLGVPRVLLFSTGYMANLGVIDALVGRGDVVIEDKLNHASLLDGARLSDARLMRYNHNDMTSLHQRLHTASDFRRRLIAVDGVFSMDGDLAPLPEIIDLAVQHRAGVLVDDAHGFGVIGKQGRGSLAHWQLDNTQMPIYMGTLGKALGTAGAFVAADDAVIDTLIQSARSYVYTTAQPDAIAAATLAALDCLQRDHWRQDKLQSLIQRFRTGAEQLGLQLMDSTTPIQPVVIGDSRKAVRIGQQLEQAGILAGVIRPPTVPKNTARLRVTLSASHTEEDIDLLLNALEQSDACL